MPCSQPLQSFQFTIINLLRQGRQASYSLSPTVAGQGVSCRPGRSQPHCAIHLKFLKAPRPSLWLHQAKLLPALDHHGRRDQAGVGVNCNDKRQKVRIEDAKTSSVYLQRGRCGPRHQLGAGRPDSTAPARPRSGDVGEGLRLAAAGMGCPAEPSKVAAYRASGRGVMPSCCQVLSQMGSPKLEGVSVRF